MSIWTGAVFKLYRYISKTQARVSNWKLLFCKNSGRNRSIMADVPESAFGFYRNKNGGPGNPQKQKFKAKFHDLVNKKKSPKTKSKGKNLKKKVPQLKEGLDEWSVRRVQFNTLQTDGGHSRKYAEFDEDSRETGKKLLQWMISPTDVDNMMRKFWEKKPFSVKRDNAKYFSKILSLPEIDKMLKEKHVEYTTNVDVTTYKDGQRETLNPAGRASAADIWSAYNNDSCSIRFLNPHLFFSEVYAMSVKLQEYFRCMVGANVYLTPPHSQGFAPHYDDIEAFILQIEGKKHWRVYPARNGAEILPRTSSPNFTQEEIGEPLVDMVLEAGDLLYFPRGYIHQANTVPGSHSLHVTLSTYQKNSWADLMEALVPAALSEAIRSDVEFRKGLPLEMSQLLGAIHGNSAVTEERKKMLSHVRGLFGRLVNYLPVDSAVDQIQKKFQHDALPPVMTPLECERSVRGGEIRVKNGVVRATGADSFTVETTFRLLRANILRLVHEEDEVRLYYHTENSKFYHEYEPTFLEIDPEVIPAIEKLVRAYPAYKSAAQNAEDPDEADSTLDVYTVLWNRGLLITKNVPLMTKD